MTRARFAVVLTLVAFCGLASHVQTPAPQTAYRFQPVVPGVYSAIGTGTLNVGSNSTVIVNPDDVPHKTHFPTIAGPGVNVPAVSRLYEVIERRADQ